MPALTTDMPTTMTVASIDASMRVLATGTITTGAAVKKEVTTGTGIIVADTATPNAAMAKGVTHTVTAMTIAVTIAAGAMTAGITGAAGFKYRIG